MHTALGLSHKAGLVVHTHIGKTQSSRKASATKHTGGQSEALRCCLSPTRGITILLLYSLGVETGSFNLPTYVQIYVLKMAQWLRRALAQLSGGSTRL